MRKAMAPGVEIRVVYERTDLVDEVLWTVERSLLDGRCRSSPSRSRPSAASAPA